MNLTKKHKKKVKNIEKQLTKYTNEGFVQIK